MRLAPKQREEVQVKKAQLRRYIKRFVITLLITVVLAGALFTINAQAAGISIDLTPQTEDQGGTLGTLEVLFLFAILALAPSILLMMTSFTRIVIVLSFLRSALGTQQAPPNQVIVGLALFLSLFIMSPVIDQINTQAYKPYKEGTITQEQATTLAIKPIKIFMLEQTQRKDLNLFLSISGTVQLEEISANNEEILDKLSLAVLVPAFITSELKSAFTMGFLLFVPFLIIDMVVASTLMSMGMVMLPPAMISLPFKLMMFVLVDGWSMLLGTLVRSFS